MRYEYKFFINIIFTFFASQLNAQQGWPPVGAEWYYSYQARSMDSGWDKTEYIYFEVIKDTTINDTSCKKINVEYYKINNEKEILGSEFIFSKENQVYNYHHNHFYLLYDFSIEKGDTTDLFGSILIIE